MCFVPFPFKTTTLEQAIVGGIPICTQGDTRAALVSVWSALEWDGLQLGPAWSDLSGLLLPYLRDQ